MTEKEKRVFEIVIRESVLYIANSIKNNTELLLEHEKRIKKLEKQLQELEKK